jgi:hypothetical protein
MTTALTAIKWLTVIAVVAGLIACSPEEKVPGQVPSSVYSVPDIEAATPLPLTLNEVSEVFALGSRSTDLQREELTGVLVGSVVQWPLDVYEVSSEGDAYRVIVQPKPATEPSAVNLMHVIVLVTPRSDSDRALIRGVKTGDTITIKGRVSEISMRAVIVIYPAILQTTP